MEMSFGTLFLLEQHGMAAFLFHSAVPFTMVRNGASTHVKSYDTLPDNGRRRKGEPKVTGEHPSNYVLHP